MPRFACANWRPISTNTGGHCSPLGVLMHQQVGYGSLFGFFNNPASQVSAHFWVARAGTIEQYVDTSTVAWHAKQLNTSYCGIEFEGYPTDAITDAQVAAGGRILAEGARVHGWPLVLANAAGQRGFGYHRMPGGVNTACPSDLRLARRPDMLNAAGGAAPVPTEEDELTVLVQAPNGGWTVVNLAEGTYKGISTPGLLDWYGKCGVKRVERPADWSRLKQVGTI